MFLTISERVRSVFSVFFHLVSEGDDHRSMVLVVDLVSLHIFLFINSTLSFFHLLLYLLR